VRWLEGEPVCGWAGLAGVARKNPATAPALTGRGLVEIAR